MKADLREIHGAPTRAAAEVALAVSVHDADYPGALRDLPDRPPVLYAKGDIRAIERSVACIGTREPSEFGRKITAAIVGWLVEARWTIVSGLAVGVDELSHATALGWGGGPWP